MDHNYNDAPLLTSSDYECIMEDLKPETFADFGSPFRMDQNVATYEDPMINPVMRPLVQNPELLPPPPPPPLEEYGSVLVQGRRESLSVLVTTPPELSPSLSPTGTIPSRDEYPGHLEFEIQLDATTSSKKSWLYSHTLKKVFIDMNKSLLIQFRVNEFMNGLFVRALPVYEQDDFVTIPVTRCGLHAISDDPHNKAHPEPGVCHCPRHDMVRHVVLCSHPQASFDYNRESDRHSVVVPLQAPHPGSDTTTVEYHFTCKTSCPGGMNRKPIVVIYTLENEQCEVLGRLILPVKICSCPKRDKEKEEKEREEREREEQDAAKNGFAVPKQGKRRLSGHERQEAKRVKTENSRQNGATQEASDVIKKIDNLDMKLNQFEQKMDIKFNQLEQKLESFKDELDQKLNQFRDEMLEAMSQVMKPNYI